MKLFIRKLISFMLFFTFSYITVITAVLSLNKIRLKKYRLGDSITTVIAGDSHTMWSIDDRKLNGVRNISLNAEGYIYTYAKLVHLLKQGNKIEKLYLGLSFHNLSGYYDDYIYGKRSLSFFYRYIEILGLQDYMTLMISNPKNAITMSPVLLRKGIDMLFKRKHTSFGSFPSENMLQKLDHGKMVKRVQEQYYQDNTVAPFSKMNVAFLVRIIDLCKKNGIKIIAITTPQHSGYCNSIPREYIDAYQQFITEHNLPVYDFTGLTMADSCYLPDGDHVNSCGAPIVTDYFKKYLENEEQSEKYHCK